MFHVVHTYEPVATERTVRQGTAVTDVLQRCSVKDCDKHRTVEVRGHWTMADVVRSGGSRK